MPPHARKPVSKKPKRKSCPKSQTKSPSPASPSHHQTTARASGALDSPSQSDMLCLQKTVGNRRLGELLNPKQPMQTKLTVGPANDKYEQEADQVAKNVAKQINAPSPQPLQRQVPEKEEELQVKGGGNVLQKPTTGLPPISLQLFRMNSCVVHPFNLSLDNASFVGKHIAASAATARQKSRARVIADASMDGRPQTFFEPADLKSYISGLTGNISSGSPYFLSRGNTNVRRLRATQGNPPTGNWTYGNQNKRLINDIVIKFKNQGATKKFVKGRNRWEYNVKLRPYHLTTRTGQGGIFNRRNR